MMTLLSTLNSPFVGNNHGGQLRVFFTTLNSDDFKMNGQALFWLGGATNDTYALPSGDKITLQLQMEGNQQAGQLFIQGHIKVTTKSGVMFDSAALGRFQSNGGLFNPGQANPQPIVLKVSATQPVGGLTFEADAELSVPWNGTTADCHGTWHAKWL